MTKACNDQAVRGLEPDDPPSNVTPRKSRSGKWRAAALLAVHVAIAIHIAHWWKSGSTLTPLEPSESMEFSKRGLVNAGAIFFALTIMSTAIFGRFFCGWACHLVALQDGCRWLLEKAGIRPRPVNLGILGSVPWILFVYMFLAPLIYRAINGMGVGMSGVQLRTNLFWSTFPGWPMALTTLVSCGAVLVYFLGAKGFCTYGCPYGAIFGIADQFAPLRIRVTDACNGCGHCTAVCTSNVRVHQEVRDWKTVVDPGCMKCLDCVSVCPTDALYVGWGAPALLTSRAKPAKQTPASGSRLARASLSGIFMWAALTLLLFHTGELKLGFALTLAPIALIVAFLFAGKAQRPGSPSFGENLLLAGVFLVGLYAFRGYAMIPGVAEGVPLLLAIGLAALAAYFALIVARMLARSSVSLQSFEIWRERKLTRAGLGFAALVVPFALLLGDGVRTQLETDIGRARQALELARARAAYDRGVALAQTDDISGAIAAFEEAIRLQPEFLEALENLAGMYCASGQFDKGIEKYNAALLIRPGDADTHFMIGRALIAAGKAPAAEEHWKEAVHLRPDHAQAHLGLAEFAEQRGDAESARRHRQSAQAHKQVPLR